MTTPFKTLALVAALTLATSAALAQTTVDKAWVRGTVAQQKATGAFFSITSAQGGTLVSAASPAADVVEIHEMKMVGDVMKMGAIKGLELPAGKAVELKPGGYHVMLMGLKKPLAAGDTVPLTLNVQGKDGKLETLALTVPVQALGAKPANPHAGHDHGSMKH